MIEVKRLVKEFRGGIRAVDALSFDVPKGQILGFLGPNGAGKSTTMKILTGFIEPTSGTAFVDGKDIQRDSLGVRKCVGYLPESAPSYSEMTVCEFLNFIVELRGFRGPARITAAERMRETCFLQDVWHQAIETLSKGYRQRVGFAQALLHDPPVLILDEPTDGLDPNQKHEVRQLIRRMGSDKTIILSTHILEEVEAVCHRVVIIAQGRIVADSTPAVLMQGSTYHNAVTLTFSGSELSGTERLLAALADVKSVETVPELPNTLRVFPREGRAIVGPVSQLAREKNWAIQGMHVEHGRIDEVFRKVTGASPRNARLTTPSRLSGDHS